jgi:hypothetical protein
MGYRCETQEEDRQRRKGWKRGDSALLTIAFVCCSRLGGPDLEILVLAGLALACFSPRKAVEEAWSVETPPALHWLGGQRLRGISAENC